MDHLEIQTRIDNVRATMRDKGIDRPVANFTLSDRDPSLYLSWGGNKDYKFFHGEPEAILSAAEAYVADLPGAEENARQRFAATLASAIDFGRKSGVDVTQLEQIAEKA